MRLKQYISIFIALATAIQSGSAWSQQAGTIKLLVGFPAGGAPDFVARQFAEALHQVAPGYTVVVENRSGASGKLAVDGVLANAADGLTAMVMPSSALILVPLVVKSATYDIERDFVALGNLAEYGFGIAAGPASDSKQITSFLQWAKAQPAKANYATPGLGTPQHFLGAELEKTSGVELTHVPYRGGATALADLLGGQVSALITTEPLLVPHHTQRKLRTLMVTSTERNAKMPDVPTVREAGFPKLEAQDWFGLFVKPSVSADKMNEWRQLIAKVIALPSYRRAVTDQGYTLPKATDQTLEKRLSIEREAWTQRVRLSGFKSTD
jgi:tripartite-type tricarboxylate transporter receptor subunit TctC